MVICREKVSEWKIRWLKKVKQSKGEYGAILRCIKARHIRCHHWTPYLEWDPALRWYISHFDSVRLEGSFKKWRPVSLSVMWDREALVAAHLSGKSTYLPLIQTYKSCWDYNSVCCLLWHWVSLSRMMSRLQTTLQKVFVELCLEPKFLIWV